MLCLVSNRWHTVLHSAQTVLDFTLSAFPPCWALAWGATKSTQGAGGTQGGRLSAVHDCRIILALRHPGAITVEHSQFVLVCVHSVAWLRLTADHSQWRDAEWDASENADQQEQDERKPGTDDDADGVPRSLPGGVNLDP